MFLLILGILCLQISCGANKYHISLQKFLDSKEIRHNKAYNLEIDIALSEGSLARVYANIESNLDVTRCDTIRNPLYYGEQRYRDPLARTHSGERHATVITALSKVLAQGDSCFVDVLERLSSRRL